MGPGLRRDDDCPTGKSDFRFTELKSSREIKNISLFQKRKSGVYIARPARYEGRAHVTNARRDAVDAGLRADDGVDERTAKPCGPGIRRRCQAAGRWKPRGGSWTVATESTKISSPGRSRH